MSFATREMLIGGFKRRFAEVPLPSGDTVRIQNLTAGEKNKYDQWPFDVDRKGGVKLNQERFLKTPALLIAMCVVDENGERVFADTDVDGILTHMEGCDSDVIVRQCNAHLEHRSLEQSVKNSAATPCGDSP